MKLLFALVLFIFGASALANSQSYQCVESCFKRDYRGLCIERGPQFCGEQAKCVKNCVARHFNEQCANYGPDFCGYNATCKPRCVDLYNGYCNQWSADTCYESRGGWLFNF